MHPLDVVVEYNVFWREVVLLLKRACGGTQSIRCRNHLDNARTPVVVFSSATRVKAQNLGADEFVVKPSSGLKFGEVVEGLQQRWLGRGQRGRSC
jgi:hypothetical protein